MSFTSSDFTGVRLERLVEFCRKVHTIRQTPDLISLVASEAEYVGLCRKITDPKEKFQKRFAAVCRANRIDPDAIRKRVRLVASVLGVYKQVDYYKILDVPSDADAQAIKRAYRKKAQIFHPDKALGDDKDGAEFVKLHDAYVHLNDPHVRELYDRMRIGAGHWIEGDESKQRSVIGGGVGRFLSWFFIMIGSMVIVTYAFDLYQDEPLTFLEQHVSSNRMDGQYADPTQIPNEPTARGGLTSPTNDNIEIAALRKHFPEPTPMGMEPSEKPDDTVDELMFFNPRREKRFWASETSRHDSLDDAVAALADLYHRTPEWVQSHMGEENALQAIHQKLSEKQAIEKTLAESAQIEKMPQDKALEKAIEQEPPAVASYAGPCEPGPEPVAGVDHKDEPHAVVAALTKAKIASFPEKEKVTRNKPEMPAPKVQPIEKRVAADVTMRPKQERPTALRTRAGTYEKPAVVKSKKTVIMPTAKTNVLKSIKNGPSYYAEEQRRVAVFLKEYTQAYERKNLDRFKSFFAKGALEQGKQFEKMLPTYRKTFRLVEALRYHIDIQSFQIDNISKKIIVKGAFTASYRLPKKDWGSSSGSIRLELLDTPRGLLVCRLDYEMRDQ
jgi:hypothetical protein